MRPGAPGAGAAARALTAYDNLMPGTCGRGSTAAACSAPGSCSTRSSAPAQAPASGVPTGLHGHARTVSPPAQTRALRKEGHPGNRCA